MPWAGSFVSKADPSWAARSAAISQGITDADQKKAEAAKRISEVEAKLATLQPEIEKLKSEMRNEQAREVERARARNLAQIQHLHEQSREEVESAYKSARLQLEKHAGQLAIDLAETKIRARMSPEAQRKLRARLRQQPFVARRA